MSTFRKYLLLQIPGWIVWGLILVGAHSWLNLPLWSGLVLLGLAVGKDFALYPYVRSAYESNVKTGAARLLGARGQVYQALNPQGYVQINGELWRAEIKPVDQEAGQPARFQAEEAGLSLPTGSRVTVRAFRGLTLVVDPEEPGP
ncbi:MAG: NfeD family protein [Desulfurellaceae bacterium]|nr:NfeD family protein [Desulfurellaceae bacterium]